jgi:hypothetical protein
MNRANSHLIKYRLIGGINKAIAKTSRKLGKLKRQLAQCPVHINLISGQFKNSY